MTHTKTTNQRLKRTAAPLAAPPDSAHQWVRTAFQGQTLPAAWDAEAYAVWFFNFLRVDVASLTIGQQLDLRANLMAFVGTESTSDDPEWPEAWVPIDVVVALQRIGREGLQRVREGKWWQHENGIRDGIALQGDRIISGQRHAPTYGDLFRTAAMDTIKRNWRRLRLCPKCHGDFVKVGKQKYCSRQCMQRAQWDSFKSNRPPRDHQQEYARRVKKRQPLAKIAHKKRP